MSNNNIANHIEELHRALAEHAEYCCLYELIAKNLEHVEYKDLQPILYQAWEGLEGDCYQDELEELIMDIEYLISTHKIL